MPCCYLWRRPGRSRAGVLARAEQGLALNVPPGSVLWQAGCNWQAELLANLGGRDGPAAFMVLNATLLSATKELPEEQTLLIPGQRAWLDFFRVLGYDSISSALQAARAKPDLLGLLTSVALYHVAGTPELNLTSALPVAVPHLTALEGFNVSLVFPNGTDGGIGGVEGQVGTDAAVLEAFEVCGSHALLLDSVLLPAQTDAVPRTAPSGILAALETLAYEDAEQVEVLPSPPASPPAAAPAPAGDGCPFATWADAVPRFPNLSIMAGLLKLAGLTLDVLGSPATPSSLMLPTSSAMLNFIHGLNITDQDAKLLAAKVPAIAAYASVPARLEQSELYPAQRVDTLLSQLSGGYYPLVFRVSTHAQPMVNQVRGFLNTAFITGTQTVCNSTIFQVDKTLLPSDTLSTMPTLNLRA